MSASAAPWTRFVQMDLSKRYPGVEFVVTESSLAFDRWSLPVGIAFQEVLQHAIHLARHNGLRSTLILDTNPDAEKWRSSNLITLQDDSLYPDRDYATLARQGREAIFSRFAQRILDEMKKPEPVVAIIDHHFSSPLMASTSTTPMTVDFLLWLHEQPDTEDRRRLTEFFVNGFVLRDHSDADITLSNFALRSAGRPEVLKKWGALIKAVALYNDHLVLPEVSEGLDTREIVLTYHLVRAFEDYIPKHLGQGFETFIDGLPRYLEWIRDLASQSQESQVSRFLVQALEGLVDGSFKRGGDLALAEELLIQELHRVRTMAAVLEKIVVRGQISAAQGQLEVAELSRDVVGSLQKRGPVFAAFVPPESSDIPDGNEGLMFMRQNVPELLKGTALFLLVTREGPTASRWQVKLRALGGFVLDPLLPHLRSMGGGGRSGAGRLYGAAGKEATLDELINDLNELAILTAKNCASLLIP